ncbi:ubiquitin carboxyl-terminal hydrolase 16 [Malaya genurostris]|uniref:ubiquitin carboxyl-terminal hydrolase 16 n=1 Tax=Malaya genurostris TaxID=325434 RepID=UPI0026F3AD40|nr:ubiquitin carboxyl-terminal hydrolase 16 [Malaya genurostris]
MVKKKCNEFKDDGSSTESNDDARINNHYPNMREACPHAKLSVAPNVLRKELRSTGLAQKCNKCTGSKPTQAIENPVRIMEDEDYEMEEDSSLWLCLKCGVQLCGRYRNQHALGHFKTPHSDQHSLALNTTTFKVWCYACDAEVTPKSFPKLTECVELVMREANKAKDVPPTISNIEQKLLSTAESVRAVIGDGFPTPVASGSTHSNSTLASSARSDVGTSSSAAAPYVPIYRDIRLDGLGKKLPMVLGIVDNLPRVRGLSNLGNTCFFNAVLQCLARTPYLLDVLQESAAKGEKFQLPGGELKLKDGRVTELRTITGELGTWGNLTEALAEILTELQSGAGGVITPSRLLQQLTSRWPQFAGADQHDSHELLRHLLESVRYEDLRRYQRVILNSLGFTTKTDPQTVDETLKEKVKFYGNQANDRIIRPEPVFRGFLVSTLTCQDCQHISSRHEPFLDLSLPVSSEKPQPPNRRKASPEPDYGYSGSGSSGTPKPLSRKEHRHLRKANRSKRDKFLRDLDPLLGAVPASADDRTKVAHDDDDDDDDNGGGGGGEGGAAGGGGGDAESGADDDGMSDADVEDNLTDDSQPKKALAGVDQNGNQSTAAGEGTVPEKKDDTPENPNKVEIGEGNLVCELGLSAEGAVHMMKKMNIESEQEQDAKKQKIRRQRTYSHADWGSTLAPRYQCEDNECSIQSCFNSFTAVEMMTGNNKVCCDACTERINGKDGKSVNTNATKQFLISSPPAVMILHLKRFQVGPRGMLRKITKSVAFSFVLDIAPFCGSRVKKLPNVKPGQKKLLYSLYGIVEHSGTMHGGHYVAYVKVRPKLSRDDPRWGFLPKGSRAELDQEDEEALQLERDRAKDQARQMISNAMARDSDDALTSSSSSTSRSSTGTTSDGEEEGAVGYTPKPETLPDVGAPPGKWYYVSDSQVREVTEESVLNTQPYLLFYERFF